MLTNTGQLRTHSRGHVRTRVTLTCGEMIALALMLGSGDAGDAPVDGDAAIEISAKRGSADSCVQNRPTQNH